MSIYHLPISIYQRPCTDYFILAPIESFGSETQGLRMKTLKADGSGLTRYAAIEIEALYLVDL